MQHMERTSWRRPTLYCFFIKISFILPICSIHPNINCIYIRKDKNRYMRTAMLVQLLATFISRNGRRRRFRSRMGQSQRRAQLERDYCKRRVLCFWRFWDDDRWKYKRIYNNKSYDSFGGSSDCPKSIARLSPIIWKVHYPMRKLHVRIFHLYFEWKEERCIFWIFWN